MPHKIAIILHDEFEVWRAPAWFVERLRRDFPGVDVANSSVRRTDQDALRGADIVIGWSLSQEQLRAAAELRWIYSITAAVDQFLYPAMAASDILVTNAARVHGPVVAEHGIALVLALAR